MSTSKQASDGNKVEDKKTETEGASSKSEAGSEEAPKATEDKHVNFLRDYLAQSLGLREKPKSKLEEISLAGIAKYIMSDQCKNIVTMAGAGISTSAGIPDFRSPDTGLYNNLASYDLPHPQAIFELDFFKENPRPFFVLAKELYPGVFKPTICHYFIKMLSDKGKLLRHYTQNIDTLERVAGMSEEKVVEAHGTFHSSHCLECQKEFSLEWMKEQIFSDKIPKCTEESCEGIVKPDIVFFGESLPKRFVECVEPDMKECDLLIVLGTSLQVQPFASLVNRVSLETPRLYINLERGLETANPITALLFGGGFDFESEDNYRDVFKQAKCDDGCTELADLMGWGTELRNMVKTEYQKIDKKNPKVSGASGASGAKAAPKVPVTKSKSPATASSSSPSSGPAKTTGTKGKDTKGPKPGSKGKMCELKSVFVQS